MKARILVVDDDDRVRTSLVEALDGATMATESAHSAERALTLLDDGLPDVVLSDIRMPGLDGIELLRTLRDRAPTVAVVLMTAYDDMPTVVRAMREGATDFLSKPIDLHELRRVLDRVLEDRKLRERTKQIKKEEAAPYGLEQLVGSDPQMIEIYKLVGQLAANRANCLIRGETGTGKELIARAIHYNSPDAQEPFLPVNCTAIPADLLESELFGHVKGAFTGATSERRGRFALAGHGTIFLDEIGDTPPEFQSKILRVLEDRAYYPVGAERPMTTEARVIAATHRNLEELVNQGAFREDLFYRLQIVEICIPPLRERLSDLPRLSEHLLARTAEELHRKPPVISPPAMDALRQHDWPGNVRELENTLTRALVRTTGDVIRPEHLAPLETSPAVDSLLPLHDVERNHIEQILRATEGNKTRAAEILEISRPRLNRLIQRYGLE